MSPRSQKNHLALSLVVTLIGSFFFPYNVSKKDEGRTDESLPPFKLVHEFNRGGIVPLRKAWILIGSSDFSRENLDKVFRWYSKRSANTRELLRVLVFTDAHNLLQDMENERLGIGYIDGQLPVSAQVTRSRLYDAFYRREVREVGSCLNISELYSYSPNLNNLDDIRTVILKGGNPFARQKNTVTWTRSNGGLRIQVSTFDFEGNIEPAGKYYTFSYSVSSEPVDSILTIQSDIAIVSVENRARFIGDKICYVFLGECFAVTLDGGQSWTRWDAEQEIHSLACCRLPVISQVQISSNGSGTMILDLPQQQESRMILHTKDYGQHWRKE